MRDHAIEIDYYTFERPDVLQFPCHDYESKMLNTLYWVRDCLRNLVALELSECTCSVITELCRIKEFKLQYFGVTLPPSNLPFEWVTEHGKIPFLLKSLLSNMKNLEVLRVDNTYGFTGVIIRTLTELQIGLKRAFFSQKSHLISIVPGSVVNYESIENLDEKTLTKFKAMLHDKNPNLDCSDFGFVLHSEEKQRKFQAMDFGFTFESSQSVESYFHEEHFLLRNPNFRKEIGLQY